MTSSASRSFIAGHFLASSILMLLAVSPAWAGTSTMTMASAKAAATAPLAAMRTTAQAQANPYAPSYGHPYRHGAIPTLETLAKMKQWRASHPDMYATSSNTLYYGGGTTSSSQGNVGVMNGKVKVYLVFWGSGWGTQGTDSNGDATFSGDPDGAAPVAQEMFKDIGTGGETWSAELTQWCQGISSGASSCPSSTPLSAYVPYQSGGILAGVWEDTSATTPIDATAAQLAQEAVNAAQHFGNTTPASNRYTYYVIISAHGDDPDNYQSSTNGYCAWHDWTGDYGLNPSVGDLAFSNQPYNMDLGASCGVGFVNSPGTLDGWTMTLGHEWQEMMSDTYPAGGWTATNNSGYENADECAWLSSGQGAAANVTMGTGTFTEQSSWSNDTNECDLSHVVVPHSADGSVVTVPNVTANGTLAGAVSNGDSLTFAIVANPSHGSVSITNPSTGTFSYYPQLNYSGNDSFTFHVTDGSGTVSDTATESVVVSNNNPPTASNGSASTSTNTPVNGTLAGSDSDGDTLTFTVAAAPAHGSVTITNASTGAFTYTPASGYAGNDSFTFKVTDSAGLNSNTATESMTVADTAPTATGASFSTSSNQALSGQLQGNANDAGQTLTFSVAQTPSHGTVTVNANGQFSYTPATGYVGSDSFTFIVNDGYLNSTPATVSITVNDTAPAAASASFSTPVATAYSGQLQANNPDNNQTLTYSIVSQPSHGTVSITNVNTGAYTYTPSSGYIGSDSFTFKVNDGYLDSNTAIVSASVTDIAPVARKASYNVAFNGHVSGTLKATAASSSQVLTYSIVSQPANGSVSIDSSTGQFTYIPNHNYSGTDSFTFKANDGTLDSNTAAVTLTISASQGGGGGTFAPWGLSLLAGLATLIALLRKSPRFKTQE